MFVADPDDYPPLPDPITRAAVGGDANAVIHFVAELYAEQRFERRDFDGRNLLHFAAQASDKSLMVDLVHRYRFPVHVVDTKGIHPIHYAASNDRVDTMQFLELNNVPLMVQDGQGMTPYDYAKLNNALAAMGYLKKKGADGKPPPFKVNDTDDDEDSPLPSVKSSAQLTRISSMSSMRGRRQVDDKYHLLCPTSDALLFWKDAEQVLMLARSCPLKPFPWDALPSDGTVFLGIARGPVKLVAGLIYLEETFQFDGATFAPGVSLTSPSQLPTVTCEQYECLSARCTLVCFRGSTMDITFVRCCVESATAQAHQQSVELVKERVAVGREAEFLETLKENDRKQFLLRPKKHIDASADLIIRVYKASKSQKIFRTIMSTVGSKGLIVKKFLRGILRQKRFAIAILRSRLGVFESYCADELSQLQSSIYPQILASIQSVTSAQKDAVIAYCIEQRKLRYLKARPGTFKFSYMITLDEICSKMVDDMDVAGVASSLKVIGSFLPRESVVVMQRSNSELFNAEHLARRRVTSVLLELASCFTEKTSYADFSKQAATQLADSKRLSAKSLRRSTAGVGKSSAVVPPRRPTTLNPDGPRKRPQVQFNQEQSRNSDVVEENRSSTPPPPPPPVLNTTEPTASELEREPTAIELVDGKQLHASDREKARIGSIWVPDGGFGDFLQRNGTSTNFPSDASIASPSSTFQDKKLLERTAAIRKLPYNSHRDILACDAQSCIPVLLGTKSSLRSMLARRSQRSAAATGNDDWTEDDDDDSFSDF